MSKPLTDAKIRSLKPPVAGQVDIKDTRSPGLALRLTAGSKTWSYRFTDPVTGKRQRMTLPKFPDLSLAEARDRAEGLRKLVAKGINPIEAKRQDRAEAPKRTFKALADRYLAEHARRFKKSADTDERNLRLHILPVWGKRAYASITRSDVIELAEGLIAGGRPIMANRVQSLVSKIFGFAVDGALLDANPAARLKKRSKETPLTRTLDDAEIRLFWSSIEKPPVSKGTGIALKLALLTGLRAGEVTGIHKSEVLHLEDPEKAALLIASDRVKNKRPHLVPLSPLARQLVLDARALARQGEQWLFPTRNANDDGSIDRHTLSKALSRFGEYIPADLEGAETWKQSPPTAHDLRRTFATRLSALGIPKEDRDACMNHKSGDVGSRHYDQYERQAEKRRALNLWANALAAILEGDKPGNVVMLRRQP
jgi:integrase